MKLRNRCILFSALRNHVFGQRLYSSDALKYPKITTHYTIHPRDVDPRWKGIKVQFLLTFNETKIFFRCGYGKSCR